MNRSWESFLFCMSTEIGCKMSSPPSPQSQPVSGNDTSISGSGSPPSPQPQPVSGSDTSISGSGGSGTATIVGAIVGVIFALALVVVVWVYLAIKKPKSKLWSCFGCCGFCLPSYVSMRKDLQSQEMNPFPPPDLDTAGIAGESNDRRTFSQHPEVSKAFTHEQLVEATNGFSPSNLLGEGGFGRVYKGTIAGNLVAVKQLKIGSGQGEREFRSEVDIISRVHHRHLVSLVGYCISDNHRLLVYKYVSNGTLEKALHGPGEPVMDWATRMNIALGTARGLAYLHEDCHPRIIHRDIKGSNILLDSQWEAQVADFGLAKLADDAQTHVTTRVMGTFGYVAPEYAMSGKLTDKSDVYSFGVVLLELITGKKPVDKTLVAADGEESLVEWARPRMTRALETGNVDVLADPNLKEKYDREEMFRMVEVAATCVRHSSHKRPKMVEALRSLATPDADLHQGVLAGYSKEFAPGQAADQNLRKFRQMVYSSSSTQSSGDYKGDSRSDAWVQSGSSNEFGSSNREHPVATPWLGSDEIV